MREVRTIRPEILKFDFKQELAAPEKLELYLYSEIAPDGYDWWVGEPVQSETSANFFRDKLAEYRDVKEIVLYINSAGGSVREGYGIYAQLQRHPAYVTAYIDGFANSIASIIAMAADKVVMYQNSMMGIHNAMDYIFGNASEHRKCADDLDALMEGNRQIYLTKSAGKLAEDKLIELLDAETMLNAQQCMEYGLCDEIADQAADMEKAAQMIQRVNMTMQQQISYFQSLKKSFTGAMEALRTTEPLNIPQSDPPQENKPIQFLQALAGK